MISNYKKTNIFKVNRDKDFVVLNFADIQLDGGMLPFNNFSLAYRTIKRAIEIEKPDIITLSGDQAWGNEVLKCYQRLCDAFDEFQIPYFIIFGNHDRENASAEEIYQIINNSKYGYLDKGPCDLDSFGNYSIDFLNDYNRIIHSIIMMDSRDHKTFDENDIKYVSSPINEMFYYKHNEKFIYGSDWWDGVQGKQITWYCNQIKRINNAESTVIMHAPTVEFSYYGEKYLKDKNNQKYKAIGKLGEPISSPPKSYGLYEKCVELKSTKNILVGHDHVNDLSIVTDDGIRLTFGVKCADGCYWDSTGERNGYTKLIINSFGSATIFQGYLHPSAL